MSEMVELMSRLAKEEGHNKTHIPGIKIYKLSEFHPRVPLCFQQGFFMIGQGTKRIFLNGEVYEYNADNYLVLAVPVPAECEAVATKEEPILMLQMDIDPVVISYIINIMENEFSTSSKKTPCKQQALFLTTVNDRMKDNVIRLLRVLQSPLESRILGKGLVRELVYRLMLSENASSLYDLAMKNSKVARIEKALKQLHRGYQSQIEVESLAKLVNMSPSAFHRAFKEVTSSSPIQYLKKIRLTNARDILKDSNIRVNEAAAMVGYESTAQFSREFKRYFGFNPVEVSTTLFHSNTVL